MKEQAESRSGIKEGIKKRKKEMDDRAKHMGDVVDDKSNVVETAKKFHLSTTKEGAREIKRLMKQAAESTHREFKRQNNDLENKVSKCQEAEQDLRDRTSRAKADARDARAASGKVKETKEVKASLNSVETASNNDAEFTRKELARQEQERLKSENRRKEQNQRLLSAKLKW
ncbi:MAG: hypothetical protein GC154_16905 [bacterium]|nr:hypothetical protein [bacterium]